MTDEAPSTAAVRRALAAAAEVEIVEAAPDHVDDPGRTRTVVSGAAIAELARLLAVVDGGTGDRCRCRGWPTILVRDAAGHELARWALHHQRSISGLGDSDAEMRDGPGLTEWLAGRGLVRSREVQRELARREAAEERRRAEWVRAAPPALTAAAEAASRGGPDDLADVVARHHPDPVDRILTLVAWAGFPARHTDGTPWHELIPERLLLAEPTGTILAALTSAALSPAQLEGAAELFTCLEWTRPLRAEVPEPLRSRLIAHVTATGTDPMRFRMRHGYGGPGPVGGGRAR